MSRARANNDILSLYRSNLVYDNRSQSLDFIGTEIIDLEETDYSIKSELWFKFSKIGKKRNYKTSGIITIDSSGIQIDILGEQRKCMFSADMESVISCAVQKTIEILLQVKK